MDEGNREVGRLGLARHVSKLACPCSTCKASATCVCYYKRF